MTVLRKRPTQVATLRKLRDAGFDRAERVGKGKYRIACSQCEAVCLNGVACHERGCPRGGAGVQLS